GIKDLTGLGSFVNLRFLGCDYNDLEKLNVSGNPNLEELSCLYNLIDTLDVSHNPKLTILMCARNRFKFLDVSKNPKLKLLVTIYNRLTFIDLSNNPDLEYLDLCCSSMNKINICKNNKLTYFNCIGNTDLLSVSVSDSNLINHNPKFQKDGLTKWTQNCFPTGFESDRLTSSSVKVYPNPATDILNIEGEVEKVKIYNDLGSLLFTTNSNHFSIANFPKGYYILGIYDYMGKYQMRKIIKE
ncbi:MAG: T9SS type A sorting domain-containing protein, partial [Opitutaceae bacterium]|nr:T9SS type A sorting domain-containing protein [Cytophagales bacterium]